MRRYGTGWGSWGIVDKLKQNERLVILHRSVPGHHQYELDSSPMAQRQPLPVSCMRSAEDETAPGWWFYHFEPVWGPFIQSLSRQKYVTLPEFERAASQVPGLTPIEKIIAISAFRQQQEQGVAPSRTTSAFRSERRLSAV